MGWAPATHELRRRGSGVRDEGSAQGLRRAETCVGRREGDGMAPFDECFRHREPCVLDVLLRCRVQFRAEEPGELPRADASALGQICERVRADRVLVDVLNESAQGGVARDDPGEEI